MWFPQTHFLQRRHIPRRRAHHPSRNLWGLTAHSSRVLPPKLRRPNFPTGRQAGKAKDSAQEGYSSCAKRLAASRSQAVSRRPTSKVRHFTLGFTGVNCKRICFTLYTFDFPRRVCLLNKFGTAFLLGVTGVYGKTMAKPRAEQQIVWDRPPRRLRPTRTYARKSNQTCHSTGFFWICSAGCWVVYAEMCSKNCSIDSASDQQMHPRA